MNNNDKVDILKETAPPPRIELTSLGIWQCPTCNMINYDDNTGLATCWSCDQVVRLVEAQS